MGRTQARVERWQEGTGRKPLPGGEKPLPRGENPPPRSENPLRPSLAWGAGRRSGKKDYASRIPTNGRFRARKSNCVDGRLAKISLQKGGAHRALEATSAPPPTGGGRVEREPQH